MKRKLMALFCLLAMAVSSAACSQEAAAEETTTLTGIVTSVEGTVITVREMTGGRTGMERPSGEMPSSPEGGFGGTLPEGATMPEGGFGGKRPDGETMPEDMEGTRPTGGRNGFGGEGTQVNLANAHITVEFDGGKATGTMEDITSGVFVTITLDGSGTATNIVVTESTGFGGKGGRGSGDFGGKGGRGEGGFDRLPGSTEPTA